MLPSNEDKKMLIQSMKKLTHHISNNLTRQTQIFDSLSKNDLLKIVSNLNDDNEYLRRISALLLAQLFYNNDSVKQNAIKLLQISPSQGRISLNQIPSPIQKYPSTFKKCIQLMKSQFRNDQSDKFCWTINLDRKILQIQFLQYKKYSSFTFLDPNRNIFGFTFITKKKRQILRRSLKQKSQQKSSKSINSNSSSKRQSMSNNSFYKNYIQNKSRMDNPLSNRVSQQKETIFLNMPGNNRKQWPTNNSQSKTTTIQSISQYAKANTPNQDSKIQTSPIRNKTSSGIRLQLDLLNQSQQTNTHKYQKRSPIGSASKQTHNTSYKAPNTQRKSIENNNYRFKINQSTIHNQAINQKIKYPESTRNSYISQHQKFYKRVKQILKK